MKGAIKEAFDLMEAREEARERKEKWRVVSYLVGKKFAHLGITRSELTDILQEGATYDRAVRKAHEMWEQREKRNRTTQTQELLAKQQLGYDN